MRLNNILGKFLLSLSLASVAITFVSVPTANAATSNDPDHPYATSAQQPSGATTVRLPAFAQSGQTGGSSAGSSVGCSNLGQRDLNGVVNCVVSIFNSLIYLMIAASVVYIVYGAFLMISNEEKREDGKKIIYHGIIGLFVMISIWGFVNILKQTFGLSNVQSNQVVPDTFIRPR